MFEITAYERTARCCDCGKTTECLVLKTEAFTDLHCEKCTMKEARKRGKKTATPVAQPVPEPPGDDINF